MPLAGIEPALLAELDFESSASTSSATGALAAGSEPDVTKRADYSHGRRPVNPRQSESVDGQTLAVTPYGQLRDPSLTIASPYASE